MKLFQNLIFLLIIFFIFTSPINAIGKPDLSDNIILDQLDEINMTELNREVEKINNRADELIPHLNIKKVLLGFIRGDLQLNWRIIIGSGLKYLGQEVTANIYLLGQIIILAV